MSNDLIGLANLSQMFFMKGNYYDTLRDFANMENAYKEAVTFNHTQAMNRLGLYYDDIADEEKMLKYYLLAIDLEDTSAMYNLARYYHDKKDYEKMISYYLLAINLKDADSCYELAIHYQLIKDLENMTKYYILACEMEKPITVDTLNNGFHDFNPFILLQILESIENPSAKVKAKLEKLASSKEIVIYRNKIRISKQLNHLEDCIICYENKLHINIYCGHCFCIDCYPNLFDKSCPLCRISKNSCAFV